MSTLSSHSPEQARTLGIIRMSFLTGVLMFGGVTYFLHRQPDYVAPGDHPQLRLMIGAILLLCVAGIFFARMKLGSVRTPGEMSTFQMIGWACGEAAALAGGVYYFLTDNPTLYIIGLFVILASFIVIPLRR